MKAMRFSRQFTFVVLFLVAVSSAYSYVLLSPRRTWSSPPTVIVDNRGSSSIADGDGGATRTVSAIGAWNGAGTGTRLSAVKGSVAGWRLGDNQPMLNFTDPQRACKGSCLAATFTGFYTGSQINDADIVTNTRYNWTSQGEDPNGAGCSSEFYIEGVMTHEVGHLLGIGHSNVSGATMYPSVSSCNNNPASLENDDRAALNDLY